jgi:hypothetical protein
MAELTKRLRYTVTRCRTEDKKVYVKWLNSRGAWEFELCENTFENRVQQTGAQMARRYDINTAWGDQRGLDYMVNAETQETITAHIEPIPAKFTERYIDMLHSIQSHDIYVLNSSQQWIRAQASNVLTNLKSNAQTFYMQFTINMPMRDL